MFGASYQFTQPPLKAVNGEYNVELTKVEEMNLKGYPVLRFHFKYEDGKPRVPDYFDLFDCQNPSDEKSLRAFNIKASRIALCFGLHGAFCPESYQSWVGLRGRIFVKRDDSGFINVTDWIDKSDIATEQSPTF